MIEVERKFIVSKDHFTCLVRHCEAEPIGRTQYEDTYYDNVEHSLLANNTLLRKRSGKFELKTLVYSFPNAWNEVDDEADIADHLDIERDDDSLACLEDNLDWNGILPIGTIRTNRTSCRVSGLTLVFDECDFENYHVMEIERCVSLRGEIPHALSVIDDFVKRFHLVQNFVETREHKIEAFIRSIASNR